MQEAHLQRTQNCVSDINNDRAKEFLPTIFWAYSHPI